MNLVPGIFRLREGVNVLIKHCNLSNLLMMLHKVAHSFKSLMP